MLKNSKNVIIQKDPIQSLIDNLICPITQELMTEPVSIVVDGKLISYEKKALEKWFVIKGEKIDPKSNKKIEVGPFDNIELKNLIEEYKLSLKKHEQSFPFDHCNEKNSTKDENKTSLPDILTKHNNKSEKIENNAVTMQTEKNINIEIGNENSADLEIQAVCLSLSKWVAELESNQLPISRIMQINNLVIYCNKFYEILDYLYEDRKDIANEILKLCKELNEFFSNLLSESEVLHLINKLIAHFNLCIQLHDTNIGSANDYTVAKIIESELHNYSSSLASHVLNSATCKKRPQILKQVMMSFCYTGQIDSIKILLKHGFDINQPCVVGYLQYCENFLAYALDRCQAFVLELLELGMTVTNGNISFAIEFHSIKIVKALLEKRSDYQATITDYTNLIRIYDRADKNEEERQKAIYLLRLLCKRGPLPSSDSLVTALKYGIFEIAKILIEEFKITLPNDLSINDTITIVENCNLELLYYLKLPIPKNILIQKGGRITRLNRIEEEYCYQWLSAEKIQFCVAQGATIDKIDFNSPGVLQSPAIVKQLIEMKKNIHQMHEVDRGVFVPTLHFCAVYAADPESIRLLIAAGADIHAKTTRTGLITGETALHYAAAYAHAEAIKVLIAAGADINARNNILETPLHLTVTKSSLWIEKDAERHAICASSLLYAGANRDLKDKYDLKAVERLGGYYQSNYFWYRAFQTQAREKEIQYQDEKVPSLMTCTARCIANNFNGSYFTLTQNFFYKTKLSPALSNIVDKESINVFTPK